MVSIEKAHQTANELLGIGGFAFPYDIDVPTLGFKVADILCIPGSICFDLFPPIVDPACGQTTLAAVVAMPEAAVDEDDFAPRGEYEIWAPRQVAPVESVPVPHPVKPPPDCHFGRSVHLSDRGHDPRTNLRCTVVGH